MSKLANHIALFCAHDNTGYLMKYIDPVLGLDQPRTQALWLALMLRDARAGEPRSEQRTSIPARASRNQLAHQSARDEAGTGSKWIQSLDWIKIN
jgi:hypothetical protein